MPNKETITKKIVDFINEIGIETNYMQIDEPTFLPGILIKEGVIHIDTDKLLYPGDLLHEAGHVAVMTGEDRKKAIGNVGETKSQSEAGGEELAAIAWSYAASTYLALAPEIVFHPEGYKGAADWYIEQYTGGTYIALPYLQWLGLCYDEKQAALQQAKPYPYMQKWLRD
ncbi:MAG: hypothetical protein V4643_12670 [Bacteroidota bacterium]